MLYDTVLGHTRENIILPQECRKRSRRPINFTRFHLSLLSLYSLCPLLLFLSVRKTSSSNAIMARFQLFFYCLTMAASAVEASVAITGAQGGVNIFSGQRPMRREFSMFKNSGPAFDLYILSFQRFMEQDQTELLSYYLVAGNSSTCSIVYMRSC